MADVLKIDFAILHEIMLLPSKCKIDLSESLLNLMESELTLVGDVLNRDVILLDWSINSSKPHLKAARCLHEKGAKKIFLIASHGIFSSNSFSDLKNSGLFESVVVTNSLQTASRLRKDSSLIKTMDLSGCFAESIRRIHNGESLSSLTGEF